VTSGHHSCCTIEHGTEVIALLRIGFAGRDTNPYRQPEATACCKPTPRTWVAC